VSQALSPAMGRRYGLARVARVWRMSRATLYRHRAPDGAAAPPRPARRGPVGACSDAELVGHIRRQILASRLHGEGHRKILCGRPQEANPILSSSQRQAAQAGQTGGSRSASAGPVRSVGRRSRIRAGDLAGIRNSVPLSNRRPAFGKDPVRCALMSGLPRGACRWPSWVCACVPGAILGGVLEAQHLARHGLDCLDHSLSHHAVQRFLPDRLGLRPPPTTVRRNVTPLLPRRPRHAPSPGRLPCASSRPRRCAPSCSPAPRSPA
jgi:hypothetical protein